MEPGRVEAGCDEAGRGPLAGPVYAAAVILPPDFHHPLLNDSKKMSEKSRETLRPVIEREAVAWAVEAVSPEEIDNLNILWASVTGMQRAVRRLDPRPDFLLIDGNRSPDEIESAIWQAVTTRLVVPDRLASAREALA